VRDDAQKRNLNPAHGITFVKNILGHHSRMHVCLILFPGFRMLTYIFAIEVLRLANTCAGQKLFTWQIRSVTGAPVAAHDGTSVRCDTPDWYGAQGFDLVLLCAGDAPLSHLPMGLRAFLSRAERTGATLGGLETGGLVLAKLGFLDGREAVLPPVAGLDLAEEFPGIALSDSLFAYDRHRLTTAGGLATGDAMLGWIARTQGAALAAQTAGTLAIGRIRDAGEHQRLPRNTDPVLERMRAIMATQMERPVSLSRIAADLDLSPKQLRLRCRKGLNQTPTQIYLSVRLNRAAQLIKETQLSVAEVAVATGFASPSAFARSYRAQFGQSPRMQRHTRPAPPTDKASPTRVATPTSRSKDHEAQGPSF
jgi:AraC family carnitine catabolism transcriptional activator